MKLRIAKKLINSRLATAHQRRAAWRRVWRAHRRGSRMVRRIRLRFRWHVEPVESVWDSLSDVWLWPPLLEVEL